MADKKKALRSTVKSDMNRQKKLAEKQKEVLNTYQNSKYKTITIPPMYAPYFGNTMRVTINCITVTVRCNGTPHKVPLPHYKEIRGRMTARDNIMRIQNNMSDAKGAIFERAPGDVNLF